MLVILKSISVTPAHHHVKTEIGRVSYLEGYTVFVLIYESILICLQYCSSAEAVCQPVPRA